MKKPRKPTDLKWAYVGEYRGRPIVNIKGVVNIRQAKIIYAWLGRAIAWAESEKARK